MATLYWTGGAGDSTFATAGNWNTQRDGGGSAAAPGGTDTLFIEQTNQTINGADTGLAFAAVTISFGGNVGSAAAPLRFTCTGTVKVDTTAGTHYLAATSAGTIVGLSITQTGSGKVYIGGPGAVTTLDVGANSQYEISANCAVTTIRTSGGSGKALAGTVFTTANIGGGTLESYRGATTTNISNGVLNTKGNAAAITTANIFHGGKHINHSSSTVTTSNCYPGGKASAKGSSYQATITNPVAYEGSEHYIDSSNVVYSNSEVPIGQI